MAHTKNLAEGLEFVAGIKKKFSDATHNCYAIVGDPQSNEQRFSDDGEPSGTAGQPMLGVLAKNGLYCVTAVVTRYFGGIKLGAGGLVGAYTKAVAECVSAAKIVKSVWSDIYKAELTYSEYQAAEKRFRESGFKVVSVEFGEGVSLEIAAPAKDGEALNNYLSTLTQGGARHKQTDSKYVVY